MRGPLAHPYGQSCRAYRSDQSDRSYPSYRSSFHLPGAGGGKRAAFANGVVIAFAVAVVFLSAAFPAFAQGGFDTWSAYRARWDSIRTATIYTTETVKMLRTAIDPMEAPLSIYMEGKIDHPRRRSKANIFLNFGGMQFGSQMKVDADSTHTLERTVMVVHDRWVPLERDVPTTTTENPAALLLDVALLPNPGGEWRATGEPEDREIDVEGFALPVTFISYRNAGDTMIVSVSVDGRAVHSVRIYGANGRPRSVAEVVSYVRAGRLGFIPREIVYRQFDKDGDAYRDLRGVLVVQFNETPFEYLFE